MLVVFNYICKKNWFFSFQKENFFSGCSISSHALTVIQRLSQSLPSPESPGFLNCCSLPGSPGKWSVSSSTCWGRFHLGTGRRVLLYPVSIPGELVHPFNKSSWGSAVQRVRTLVQKENLQYCQVACPFVRLRVPSLQPGWVTSPVFQGACVVGI